MTRPVILAVDCSTTAGKAVAFEVDGTAVAESRQYLDLAQPRPGWFEQDPEQWWSACANALASVMALLHGWEPVALCITHQRESFVLLDRQGDPVRPGILWVDARAREHAVRIGTSRIHGLTGKPPSPVPSLYKLAWLRDHEPESLARTATVMDVHGFLASRLTGRGATSTASADSTGLLSLTSRTWVDDLVEVAGLTPSQLPELVEPGAVVGGVSVEASRRTGVPAGTPVIAGAGDGQCAGLGTGAGGAAGYYLNAGTSLSLGLRQSEPDCGPGYRTFVSPVPGAYDLETLVPAAGLALTWLVSSVLGGRHDAADLARAAAGVPIGSNGLAYLPGPTSADGDGGGAPGRFTGNLDEQRPAVMFRAVVEGLAVEQLATVAGLPSARPPLRQLHATGGLSKVPVFAQVLSDVLGCPVSVSREQEGTALGAAVVAAASPHVGIHRSLEEAVSRMTHTGAEYTPVTAHRHRWRELVEARRLAAMAAPHLRS